MTRMVCQKAGPYRGVEGVVVDRLGDKVALKMPKVKGSGVVVMQWLGPDEVRAVD